jgi:hypothetical protein
LHGLTEALAAVRGEHDPAASFGGLNDVFHAPPYLRPRQDRLERVDHRVASDEDGLVADGLAEQGAAACSVAGAVSGDD